MFKHRLRATTYLYIEQITLTEPQNNSLFFSGKPLLLKRVKYSITWQRFMTSTCPSTHDHSAETRQTVGEMKNCIIHPWKSLRYWRVMCLQFPWAPVVRVPLQEGLDAYRNMNFYKRGQAERWRDRMRRKKTAYKSLGS